MNFILIANVFNSLSEFFQELGNYVTFDYLVLGGLGLLLLTILVSLVRTSFTYEVKLLRNINKLNKYFAKNPYVNDENIVELNNRMKNVPRTLRYCWQEYMLNRDKAPSEYMNTTSCVDQPSKTSAYSNTATTCGTFTIVISILTLILGFAGKVANDQIRFNVLFFEVFLVPILVLVLGMLFVAFLRARHTSIISDLYYTFHEFERNMNKACTTMPAFIDYEVLFTKKEIKEGIPVLQDYLEKREIQEKREREEQELNASKFEYYDFDELGVENALLLERAMKESEKYLNVKRDLATKVNSKETEMYNYQKNFDEVTKDFERKAQAARESLAQLTDQINATTVKIEQNYMRKRHTEEQTKLQQLEKDYELATSRFQKQQEEMQAEIDAYKAEMERRRLIIEEAMKAECKNYANKIYGQISKTVQEQSKPYFDQMNEEKTNLEKTIEDLMLNINEKTGELTKVSSELDTTQQQLDMSKAELAATKELKQYLTSPEFKQSFVSKKQNKQLADGRVVEVGEDVAKQIADLQDMVRLSDQNAILYQDKITLLEKNLQSMTRELEQHRRIESELFEKAKAAQEKKKVEIKIPTMKEVQASLDAQAKVQKQREQAERLASVKPERIQPVSSSTVRAPRKRATLNSLLDQVNKIQGDKLSDKTVSSKARTIRSTDREYEDEEE